VFDVDGHGLLFRNAEDPTDALRSDSGVAFSPDGKTLAAVTARLRKPLRLFDAETGAVLRTFDGPAARGPLTFSADGKRIFSNSWGRPGVVWDVAGGKLIGEFSPQAPYD